MAVVSGCFVASANRRSYEREAFPGRSWIVSPEGDVLAETTADAPFVAVDVDLGEADAAKLGFPQNLARA